jgi:hypothetical protein
MPGASAVGDRGTLGTTTVGTVERCLACDAVVNGETPFHALFRDRRSIRSCSGGDSSLKRNTHKGIV